MKWTEMKWIELNWTELITVSPNENKAQESGDQHHELLRKSRLRLLHHPVKVILQRVKVKVNIELKNKISMQDSAIRINPN
jgi:hypothetical protein